MILEIVETGEKQSFDDEILQYMIENLLNDNGNLSLDDIAILEYEADVGLNRKELQKFFHKALKYRSEIHCEEK